MTFLLHDLFKQKNPELYNKFVQLHINLFIEFHECRRINKLSNYLFYNKKRKQ